MYPPSWLKGPAASTGWRLGTLALGLAVLAGCGSVAAAAAVPGQRIAG